MFIHPHSFYVPNLTQADLIVSLHKCPEEQTVYLLLLAILSQAPKGALVAHIPYFYTSFMSDVLFLLSAVYNKTILLFIEGQITVVCKGFQQELLRPFVPAVRQILQAMRPTTIQKIFTSSYVLGAGIGGVGGVAAPAGPGMPGGAAKTRTQSSVETDLSTMRLFNCSLPACFVSKLEEINVLIHHKTLNYLNGPWGEN
jgi:hypothetical protein